MVLKASLLDVRSQPGHRKIDIFISFFQQLLKDRHLGEGPSGINLYFMRVLNSFCFRNTDNGKEGEEFSSISLFGFAKSLAFIFFIVYTPPIHTERIGHCIFEHIGIYNAALLLSSRVDLLKNLCCKA